MRRIVVRTTAAAFALLASATAAEAQSFPKFSLLAGTGWLGESRLGNVPNELGGVSEARHHTTGNYVLGLETASPLKGVDLRLSFEYARPKLQLMRPPEMPDQIYRTSVKTLTLDAVVRGPRVLDAQLYGIVGAGVRHFDFKEVYFHDSNFPAYEKDQLVPVAHLGAGVRWNVGRYDLFVEAGGHLGRFEEDPGVPAGMRGEVDRGTLGVTVGFRVPLN